MKVYAFTVFISILTTLHCSNAASGCCPNKGGYCGFDLKRCKRSGFEDCSEIVDNALYNCQQEREYPVLIKSCERSSACFNNGTHVFCRDNCCPGVGLFCGYQLKKCQNINDHSIYNCQPGRDVVLVQHCPVPGICFNNPTNGTSCTSNCCTEKGEELCSSRLNRCSNLNNNAVYKCPSIGSDPLLMKSCKENMNCRWNPYGDFCPTDCCPYPGNYCGSELKSRCNELNNEQINGRNLYSCDSSNKATILQICSHMCLPKWSNSSCSEDLTDQCGNGMYKEHDSCIACPPGYKCDGYKSTPCDSGTCQALSQADHCIACNPGYYQPESGSSFCLPCPRGHFCKETSFADPCPVGTFQNNTGQTFCLPCPKETYAFENGSKICEPCPAGHFCVDIGTIEPEPCMNGTYATEGQGLCKSCLPGYYTETSMADDCIECPLGHYCDASSPIRCLPGTYADEVGLSECKPCPIGYTASTSGLHDCEACPVGHYCPFKTEAPILCKVASYSDRIGQTTCNTCQPGYFTDKVGSDKCKKCLVNHMCINGYLIPCPPGKYQQNLGQAYCTDCTREQEALRNHPCQKCDGSDRCMNRYQLDKCSDGYYRNTIKGICVPCPEGYFCKNEEKLSCIKGFHQPHKGQSSCLPCKLGMYADQEGAVSCELCSVGHFCMNTAHSPEKCLPGTHQPREGQTSCLSCPLGYYQQLEGQSNCLPCPKGKYCRIDEEKRNNYVVFPKSCLEGTYQNREGQVDCHYCKEGYYTSARASISCTACIDHTYCPGRGTSQPFLCPAGTSAPGQAHSTCNTCIGINLCHIPGSGMCGPCTALGSYAKQTTNVKLTSNISDQCSMKQRKCFMDMALNTMFGGIQGIVDNAEVIHVHGELNDLITNEIKVTINSACISAQSQLNNRTDGPINLSLKTSTQTVLYADQIIIIGTQILKPILNMAIGKYIGDLEDLAVSVIKMMSSNIQSVNVNSELHPRLVSTWGRIKTMGSRISNKIPFMCNIYEAITEECHHFFSSNNSQKTNSITDHFARMWITMLQPFGSIVDRYPAIFFFFALSTDQCRKSVIYSIEKNSPLSYFVSEAELKSIGVACNNEDEYEFNGKAIALLFNRTFLRLKDNIIDNTILHPAIMAVTKSSGFINGFDDEFSQNSFQYRNQSFSNVQVNKLINDWIHSIYNNTVITDGIVNELNRRINRKIAFLLSSVEILNYDAVYMVVSDKRLNNCSKNLQIYKVSDDNVFQYSVTIYEVKQSESNTGMYIIRDIREKNGSRIIESGLNSEMKYLHYVLTC